MIVLCFLLAVHRSRSSESLLKIVDFGLATIVDPTHPELMRCGSPGYVAPEILMNIGYGTKADLFSAGVILYIL